MATNGAKKISKCLGSLNITGTYLNELGSKMCITTAENGELRGTYGSGVGTDHTYPLYGSYDMDGHTLGWVVSYQRADSTCAWSGQAFEDGSGRVCIHTTWLLTSQTKEDGIWKSTRVSTDVFTPIAEGDSVTVSACPKVSNIPAHVLTKEKI